MSLLDNKALLRGLWILSICAVIVGELAPPSFPVLAAMEHMHISDKVEHFGAYFILALLPTLAIDSVPRIVLTVLSMEILGVALEFAQRLLPRRSYDLADMLANTLGVVCGVVLAVFWRRLRYHTVS